LWYIYIFWLNIACQIYGPIWGTDFLLLMVQIWVYATCRKWVFRRYELKYCFLSQGAIPIHLNARLVLSSKTSEHSYSARCIIKKEGHISINSCPEYLKNLLQSMLLVWGGVFFYLTSNRGLHTSIYLLTNMFPLFSNKSKCTAATSLKVLWSH
jgi:hypothetical protein